MYNVLLLLQDSYMETVSIIYFILAVLMKLQDGNIFVLLAHGFCLQLYKRKCVK